MATTNNTGTPNRIPVSDLMRTSAGNDRTRDARRRNAIVWGRMLYDGKWRQLLLDLQKTQHMFRDVKRHDRKVRPLVAKVNAFRLACMKHADLLLLDEPTISIPDEFPQQAQAWSRIADHCLIEQRIYELALLTNIESESYAMATREDGHTCLHVLDALQTFPVGPIGHDGQPRTIDRRWVISKRSDDGRREKHYLRIERHRSGSIENLLFETDSKTSLALHGRLKPVNLVDILGPDAPEPMIQTGIDRMLILRFANRLLRNEPQPDLPPDDYDIIDELAALMSQLSRTLSKHADPKMRVPENLVDQDGTVDAAKLEAFTDPEGKAGYITWDAKIDAMLTVLDRVLSWLLITMEMSPALVGLKDGAQQDSHEKLLLEGTNATSRAQRTAKYWRPLLERLIDTIIELDAISDSFGYSYDRVSVVLHPGLPRTQEERARTLSDQINSRLIDEETAREELHGKEKAELITDRLAQQDARRAASFIGGNLFPMPGGNEPTSVTDPESGASETEGAGQEVTA